MYKVDIKNKRLNRLINPKFSDINIFERYDIQEWIADKSEILGEELLVIQKELVLPSNKRLDLLAIDKNANLVIVELKRDDSGSEVEWQAIKYASYCSNFLHEQIFRYYADYIKKSIEESKTQIENFIDVELDNLNENQRIILVSRKFHSDVISAVLWIRDAGIDIECIRLETYQSNSDLFINADKIIPLPEAKDYIIQKEKKQRETKGTGKSTYSIEKSNYKDEKLKKELLNTIKKKSDVTPRLIAFLEILVEKEKEFSRDEIKEKFFEKGFGKDIGQAGRYLNKVSQYLTKTSTPHLRQIVEFSGKSAGKVKNNYYLLPQYRKIVIDVLKTKVE